MSPLLRDWTSKPARFALTLDNQPIDSIIITSLDLSQIPKGSRTVIAAFECSPTGSVFSSPIELTIRYDASLIPSGVSRKDLVIAYYDAQKNAWVNINSQVDPVTHTITGQISHFTLFGILSKEVPLASWKILLVVVGIELVLICVVVFFVVRRRTNRKKLAVPAISPRDFGEAETQPGNQPGVPISGEEILQSVEIDQGNTNTNSVDIFLESGESGNTPHTPIKITLKHEPALDSKNKIKIRILKLPKSDRT